MNVISGLSMLASLPSLLSSGAQRVSGDSDGDRGKESAGKSNFMNAVINALDQTLSGSSGSSGSTHSTHKPSTSTTTTQDPQVALQGFLQNLYSSLSQVSDSKPADQGVSSVASHHGSHLASELQNLMQQLSSASGSSSSGGSSSLSHLDSSFQNLVSSINSAQGQGATAAQPTLQAFLQNLMQDVGNGQNVSGAIVSTQA